MVSACSVLLRRRHTAIQRRIHLLLLLLECLIALQDAAPHAAPLVEAIRLLFGEVCAHVLQTGLQVVQCDGKRIGFWLLGSLHLARFICLREQQRHTLSKRSSGGVSVHARSSSAAFSFCVGVPSRRIDARKQQHSSLLPHMPNLQSIDSMSTTKINKQVIQRKLGASDCPGYKPPLARLR